MATSRSSVGSSTGRRKALRGEAGEHLAGVRLAAVAGVGGSSAEKKRSKFFGRPQAAWSSGPSTSRATIRRSIDVFFFVGGLRSAGQRLHATAAVLAGLPVLVELGKLNVLPSCQPEFLGQQLPCRRP